MSNRWIRARTMRLMDFLDTESELQDRVDRDSPNRNELELIDAC
jgi:hypothetical protein